MYKSNQTITIHKIIIAHKCTASTLILPMQVISGFIPLLPDFFVFLQGYPVNICAMTWMPVMKH